MTQIRIVGSIGGLIGAAEADQVGGDGPVTCGNDDGDHLAVEIGPRRFAVQEEDGGRVRLSLIEVVHSERCWLIAGCDLDIVGGEVTAGKILETIIGCTEEFHGAFLYGCWAAWLLIVVRDGDDSIVLFSSQQK